MKIKKKNFEELFNYQNKSPYIIRPVTSEFLANPIPIIPYCSEIDNNNNLYAPLEIPANPINSNKHIELDNSLPGLNSILFPNSTTPNKPIEEEVKSINTFKAVESKPEVNNNSKPPNSFTTIKPIEEHKFKNISEAEESEPAVNNISAPAPIPVSTTENPNENFIIALFKISGYKRDIRIINSYEAYQRSKGNFKFDDNLRNEQDIKKCKIEINGKIIQNSFTYEFKNEGNYKVKYIFNKPLKSAAFLFYDCKELVEIEFSHFNTESIINMQYMLAECSLLNKIDLSKLNLINVTDISYIFFDCISLQEANLSNLDTKNLVNFGNTFNQCGHLQKADLANLNTQNVTDMSCLFRRCSELKEVNLSNINTQNVTNRYQMLHFCSELKEVDLSSFNTQKVTDMGYMFYSCKSLKNLDLSNFNTDKLGNAGSMFEGCESLKHLDLSNFLDINNINTYLMIKDCNQLDISNIICYDEKLLNKLIYAKY
jgi:surface protein